MTSDDEYSEHLKQRILEAYGLDKLTPDEQAAWDAYNLLMDAFQREEEAAAARVLRNAKAVTAYINANPSMLDDLSGWEARLPGDYAGSIDIEIRQQRGGDDG